MAAPELEYLQYTFVNSILKNLNNVCDDQVCYCLDVLQMSLLSLVLKNEIEYPNGELFDYYNMVHIRVRDKSTDLFKINQCEEKGIEAFTKEKLYFDDARKKTVENEFLSDISLEKESIDYLATALFMLNGYANDTSIKKSRNCDQLLIDMSLLNPRLFLIVSYNMFYGFLCDLDVAKQYKKEEIVSRYMHLLEIANVRMESIFVHDRRNQIITEYERIFNEKTYNKTALSNHFGEYFYGLTFEKNQIEEINVLGNLDFLCRVIKRFMEKYFPDGDYKEIINMYMENLHKIMEENINQDSIFLQGQYKMPEINHLDEIDEFKNVIKNYCMERHLFIVGVSNSLTRIDDNTTNQNINDIGKKKHLTKKNVSKLVEGFKRKKPKE